MNQHPLIWRGIVAAATTLSVFAALGAAPAGPHIADFRSFYSSPYLLDFNFFLRDENDRAITDDPSAFGLRCWEDDEHGNFSEISPSETGARLLRANKQLEGFVVLDYTRSMVDPVRNGDTDGDSISDSVENMEAGARTLIDTLPKDARIGLFEFHRADAAYPPQKAADLMRDKAYLTNVIAQLWSTNVWSSGASRCWDALYGALQEWPRYNLWDDQRFIVFLSDGRDESSTRFPTNVVALALTNNVKIYCIGYGTELRPEPLLYITSLTGGRYYAATTPAELTEKFQQIAIDLRSQYIVRWATLKRQLTFPPPDGAPYYFIPGFELTYGPYGMFAVGWTNRPYLYEGDELRGRLHFASSLEPDNVASLVLRADYIPRGVTRIRVDFETAHPLAIEPIPFSEGGVCPSNWVFTFNQAQGTGFFEFASPSPNDPFSALPFAALGKLVEFKFQGVTNLTECFSQLRVDNSFYPRPGGPTLVIDNAATVGGQQVFEKDAYYVPGTTIFLQPPGEDGTGGPYQWAKDGTDLQDIGRIQGAQTQSLTIQDCEETDSGSYILTARNETRAIFRVRVLPNETETVRLTNAPGTLLVLTNRSEVGSNPRWNLYDYPIYDTLDGRITGSWTPTLTIKDCSPADAGVYVLTSGSQPVRTNAVYDVRIQTPHFSTNIAAGNNLTLSGSPGGFKYQWLKDGSPLADGDRISGSTEPNLVIRAVELDDSGIYTLKAGTVASYENAVWEVSVLRTNVITPPEIIGFTVYTGPNSARFEVVAIGDFLQYQWMWQGQDIPGATEPVLSYEDAQTTANAGYYSVRVWNEAGEASSPPPGLLFLKSAPAGTYKGVFCDPENPTPEASGELQFTLSGTTRTFSGRLLRGKSSYRFSGSLSPGHDAIVTTVQLADGVPLTLTLQLLTTDNLPGVTGTVESDSWGVVPLRGYRAAYSSRQFAPQEGKYTLALQDTSLRPVRTAPDGCGPVSLTVNRYGNVIMKGRAADGTTFSRSSSLAANGQWPVYVPMYRNQGCLVGWLQFTNSDNSVIGAELLYWMKNAQPENASYPDGFTSSLEATGSSFSTTPRPAWAWPPAPVMNVLTFTDAVASLTGGDMFSPDWSAPDAQAMWTFINVSVPAPNRLLAASGPEKLSLKVSPSTGIITGNFNHPVTGRRVPIRGIVLQDLGGALGYFLSSHCSGYFALTAPGAVQ